MNGVPEKTVIEDIPKGTGGLHSGSSGKPEKVIRKGFKFFVLAGGALFIGLAVSGIYSRNARTVELQQLTDKAARTIVEVVRPRTATETISLQLSGQTTPYTEAPIFAQTSGYLQKWYFDIGAEVTAGAVLAEIDTPEIDAKLAQAQAQLKVAEAKRDLSKEQTCRGLAKLDGLGQISDGVAKEHTRLEPLPSAFRGDQSSLFEQHPLTAF